jgi:hypothetical protein
VHRGRTGDLLGIVEGGVAHHGGPTSVGRRRSSEAVAFIGEAARAVVAGGGW